MDHRRAAEGVAAVELEIRGEIASALGNAGRMVDELVCELESIRSDIAASPEPERDALVRRFEALREEALYRLWCLQVQREAVGIPDRGDLERFYRVPRL